MSSSDELSSNPFSALFPSLDHAKQLQEALRKDDQAEGKKLYDTQ